MEAGVVPLDSTAKRAAARTRMMDRIVPYPDYEPLTAPRASSPRVVVVRRVWLGPRQDRDRQRQRQRYVAEEER